MLFPSSLLMLVCEIFLSRKVYANAPPSPPPGTESLVYGSSDGGVTVHNEDAMLHILMGQVASKLNLKVLQLLLLLFIISFFVVVCLIYISLS